jgi:TatD DNase family protein
MNETPPESPWIDSHAHLTMFEPDEVQDVLERAVESGVGGVLVPATNSEDLERTADLAAASPGRLVGAAGVHPHDASSLDGVLKRRVEEALSRDVIVAVGELGLDYHYMNSPREDQLRALEWQLDLALEFDLPVVIHNRDSWIDLERLLAARAGRLRGVCHSFTEGPEEALRVVALGLLVGISGMVTFKKADNIRRMVAALGPDDVMVETDSPFLAPMPHRGRRNEPAYVVHVGRRLAEEWEAEPSVLAAATTANFRRLFAVDPAWPGSG